MAFGFSTITTSGISQLSDSNRFYRVGLSGAYSPATSVDLSAVGCGLTYIYRPTGDLITDGKQIFVNSAIPPLTTP